MKIIEDEIPIGYSNAKLPHFLLIKQQFPAYVQIFNKKLTEISAGQLLKIYLYFFVCEEVEQR